MYKSSWPYAGRTFFFFFFFLIFTIQINIIQYNTIPTLLTMRNLHYKDTRTLYNHAISYTIIASNLFTYLFNYYYL